jgi:hypothetical protein
MRKDIRFFASLASVCLLAGLVAPNATGGTIVVGAAVAGPADMAARHIARNLGGEYVVSNRVGLDAAPAAREMQGKATDGSELMIVFGNDESTSAGRLPPASAYANLTPVAMLGVSRDGKSWYGLFAPPGTPASVVNSLNAKVRQALSTMPSPSIVVAQDMSPSALSQRMAVASRAQPATPAAPAPVAGPDARPAIAQSLQDRISQACQGPFRAFVASRHIPENQFDRMLAFWGRQLSYWGANYGCRAGLDPERHGLPEYIMPSPALTAAQLCVQRFVASPQCTGGSSTPTARVEPPRTVTGQQPSNPGTVPTPAPSPSVSPSRPAAGGSTEALGTASVASNSVAAHARQEALDEQRRGKPKRNYSDRAAHQCVSLIKGGNLTGGFINTCPFPISFVWCAYRPKKGEWSDTADCAKTKSFGNNSLRAGSRTAEHTKYAEKILWFACRVDNPYDDIVEVGDAEFDPKGPVIRARCVKWGDRS